MKKIMSAFMVMLMVFAVMPLALAQDANETPDENETVEPVLIDAGNETEGDNETEEPQEIVFDSISEDEFDDLEELEDLGDADEVLDLEELGELSDEDLDTSPDSLSNDDSIKEIVVCVVNYKPANKVESIDNEILIDGIEEIATHNGIIFSNLGAE